MLIFSVGTEDIFLIFSVGTSVGTEETDKEKSILSPGEAWWYNSGARPVYVCI